MNKSKFSLADVLTALAALAFGFVCFLGANFSNIENDKVWGMPHTTGCLFMAVAFSLILFATAFGAKLLKRSSNNFKTSFLGEVILIILFVLFAVFFSQKTSPFTHYFTTTEQKEVILSELQASIKQAEKMFAAYESYAENREALYKHNLQSVVNAKKINHNDYISYGFNSNSSVTDASQIDTKMFAVHADLFPTNYSDTTAKNGKKEVATEWLQYANKITSRWKPIGIVNVVNDIEKNSTDWRDYLVKLSQVREQGEQATDFNYDLSFADIKSHFTKIDRPSHLSIGLALLAYALMSLSWFVTKRHYRWPGLKFLFGVGKSSENKL